jgi:2-polyprenyl-3-methyl-5-hydroxy-6-metoxy-1,4-benzoquinol methylase
MSIQGQGNLTSATTGSSSATYPDDDRTGVIPYVPATTSRLLDVGCWKGAFGRKLKQANPNLTVVGIEANPAAAAIASSRLDRVVVGLFPEDLDVKEGLFDCVVFNDVLEHLVDPWNALNRAHLLLGASGKVVAAIPNIRHVRAIAPLLIRGRWEYTDTGLLDRTHLRFFTRTSMIELFRATGYSIDSITALDVSRSGLKGVGLRAVLAPFGRTTSEEFRALHYVIVASPNRPGSSANAGHT